MSACGKFYVEGSAVLFTDEEGREVIVYDGRDVADATMRCEKLSGAIATEYEECSECGSAFGHMPGCSKHRNASLKKGVQG